MSISSDQIDIWIRSPSEHQRLEFKEAKDNFDYLKLCKYCVAIANEGGGLIILGVTDKLPRQIVGTRACINPTHQAEKLFETLGFRVDIEEVQHADGKRVVVFDVPSRLRGTAYHLSGQYLMRSGEALVTMSEDQLRRILLKGSLIGSKNRQKPVWIRKKLSNSWTLRHFSNF